VRHKYVISTSNFVNLITYGDSLDNEIISQLSKVPACKLVQKRNREKSLATFAHNSFRRICSSE